MMVGDSGFSAAPTLDSVVDDADADDVVDDRPSTFWGVLRLTFGLESIL
jgi:hypothetical protein